MSVTVTHNSFYCSGECEVRVRMAVQGSVMRRRRMLVRAHLGWGASRIRFWLNDVI